MAQAITELVLQPGIITRNPGGSARAVPTMGQGKWIEESPMVVLPPCPYLFQTIFHC